jgi:hypothetical protein
MISVKKILDHLVAKGFASAWSRNTYRAYGHNNTRLIVKSDKFSMSDETYGTKSFLYFYCKSSDDAYEMMKAIREIGGNPGTSWNGGPDKGNFELRVSYFKGSRHWE